MWTMTSPSTFPPPWSTRTPCAPATCKMLAWSEHTYEHPALQKILYGVVLLTQPQIDRLPENDLPRLAPIAATEAGRWNIAARHLALAWGTLAVLALALLNPLAGLFLALSTLSVKYTSEVYLEALPLLTGLLCAMAYLRWFGLMRRAPNRPSQYTAMAGGLRHPVGHHRSRQVRPRRRGDCHPGSLRFGSLPQRTAAAHAGILGGLGSVLAPGVLRVRSIPLAPSHRAAHEVHRLPPGFPGFAPGRDVLISVLAAAALARGLRRLLRPRPLQRVPGQHRHVHLSWPPSWAFPGSSAHSASSSSGSLPGSPSCCSGPPNGRSTPSS